MKKIKSVLYIMFLIFWSCENQSVDLKEVTITSPEDNSMVSILVTIKCLISAEINIERVELLIDDNPTGIVNRLTPFSLVWNTSDYEDNDYKIIVRSYDISGNIYDSDPINVTVFKTIELWGEDYSIENTIELDLNNSMLTGSIPPTISSLVNLTSLNLSFNQLSGEIPVEMMNLRNLTNLQLMGNQITGSIPEEIGIMMDLTDLDLSINQLSGSIPPGIFNLINITNLNLSINQLTGFITLDIENMISLINLNLSNNKLSGNIPEAIENLTNLIELNLYRNEFSGYIPETLCSLVENNCSIKIYNNKFCPPYPFCIEDILGEQDISNCD